MKLIALIKKEFHRFFHDPRLIITMLLPGIVIYAIYSVLGGALQDKMQKQYDYDVYVCGQSQITGLFAAACGEKLVLTVTEDVESAKEEVESGEKTALVVFSENFDEEVAAYSPASGDAAPQVEIWYRSADEASLSFYALATEILGEYENQIANKFDVNEGSGEYDFSGEDGIASSVMGGLLPFLAVVFVFSACMSITLESVAGEKERGTLSTILVTSVKRSHVALGKIIPLSCISVIGAASSFLGIFLSMPKLMGASVGSVMGGFGFSSYLLTFLLIVSVVPLIASLITVVSAYSRSVKEASAYTSVLMIFVMMFSLLSVFLSGIGDWIVAVPVLNAVFCMQNILAFHTSVWQCLLSVGLNAAYTGLLVLAVTKMFSSEKIMYGS